MFFRESSTSRVRVPLLLRRGLSHRLVVVCTRNSCPRRAAAVSALLLIMEQQPEDERRGRRAGRPPIRLPLHTSSSRRSRSLSPFRHDDDANVYALSRPAGEAGDSGDEPSPVRETAPTTRAEEPMALSRPRWNAAPMERGLRRPPPPRDGGHYRPPPPRDDMGPAFAYADYMLDKFTGLASRDYYRRPPPPRDEDYYRPPTRAYDDAPADIRSTIDHINARRIHYRNKAATSGSDSKAIAAEAWMKALANREIDAAQEMTNGPPPRPPANPGNAPPPMPDQVELAKCRRALAAAKRALTEIHETTDDVRAAWGLAKIAEELEGEQL